jgi:hypothetical protein
VKYDDIVVIANALNAIESSMRKDVWADPRVEAAKAEAMAAEERLSQAYREALSRKKLETLRELADEDHPDSQVPAGDEPRSDPETCPGTGGPVPFDGRACLRAARRD